MANIPTLTQLYNSIIADLEQELNVTIPLFGRSYLRAKAMVQAGRLYLAYLNLAKVQKNIFVDTADSIANGGTLERFGVVKLGRYPFPAIQGQYEVEVTGSIGAVIPAQTTFKSNDDSLNPSKLYILDAAYTLTATTDTITLRALEAGDESKLSISDQLTSTAPIALVNPIATVVTEIIEPQAAENIEDYRNKAIEAYRLEPQGGASADYRLWAKEVQGIVQAYPYAASGYTSQVNLFIESDNANGVPTLADLQAVEDNIELPTATRPSRKPVTVTVNYLPVTPRVIDIEIPSFTPVPSTELQNAILDAMTSELANVRPFVGAIDVVANQNDYFDVNRIIQIILTANPGSVFAGPTLIVDGITVNSITFINGDIPFLNSITYV